MNYSGNHENTENTGKYDTKTKASDENMFKEGPLGTIEDIPMTKSLPFKQSTPTFKGNESGGPMWINVCNPTVREDNLTKFVVYTIKGTDTEGDFEILRRYSEFDALREVLQERWPGVYIPPLPEKKVMGNFKPEFIEDRRKYLEIFINTCIKIPYLYYSEEMQFFLRSKVSDAKAGLQALPKPTYEEIIQRYTTAFHHLSGYELTNEVLANIARFASFLKKLKGYFKIYKAGAKGIVNAKRDYYDQLISFNKNVLLDYEKTCLSEYAGDKQPPYVFSAESNTHLHSELMTIRDNSLKESFDALANLLKHEDKEIEAFLEALEARQRYLNIRAKLQAKVRSDTNDLQKLLSGKHTMKTVFSSKSKVFHATEHEKNIAQNNKNIESVALLYDMMTLVIGYIEIDQFKAEKIENYIKVMKQMAIQERQLNLEASVYWGNVLKVDQLKGEDNDVKIQGIHSPKNSQS